VIAMAIACKPKLLIADEPIRRWMLLFKRNYRTLKEIQQETRMSILFISHDLSLVSEIAHRVLVMYQRPNRGARRS
jgi:peptide/nickel transport system ATP-binding protein